MTKSGLLTDAEEREEKAAEKPRDWNAILEDVAVAFDQRQRPYMAREIRAIKRKGD